MSDIALSLIATLVRRGIIDADDIAEITRTLKPDQINDVNAAFVDGISPAEIITFRIIGGGKNDG